ncbi:hypothetical protein [Mesorhizobium sp.]|uniref:hypothetical protein n=1 Tax=Mesorhizobium sp. TaxID=1871066 RepID=UPI00121A59FC|nr:hypothetical protein [Mesorhizobium sp.]TIL68802.1 MAG: hypothetical protein E5Y77_06380 [Mesorhizobium sp.]
MRVIDPQPGLIGGFWTLTHPDLHKRPKIRAFFDFMLEEIVKYRPLLLGETATASSPPWNRNCPALPVLVVIVPLEAGSPAYERIANFSPARRHQHRATFGENRS